PDRSALDFYESIEGMRVEVDDARVVGPSNTFGEQYVTTKPDVAATYRGGAELLGENQIPSGRLEIATTDGSLLDLDVGDVLHDRLVELRRICPRGQPVGNRRPQPPAPRDGHARHEQAVVRRDVQRRESRAVRPGLELRGARARRCHEPGRTGHRRAGGDP